MEYAQESVATLHDFGDADPPVPADRATVVVPMTGREFRTDAAERLLAGLEGIAPAEVIVPLEAPAARVGAFAEWLDSFSLPVDVLWCSGPRLADTLADHGYDGEGGKGRDVWMGVGVARGDFVAIHDADARTYEPRDTRKLLFPLGDTDEAFSFSKGYYARVEDNRLYGRLTRLFYEPLVAALDELYDDALLDYLGAFRYALAGECAMTADLARELRVPRRWGFEVGTLAGAFEHVGASGTVQVDLGRHEHDHRPVAGPGGLSALSEDVGRAVFCALLDRGVDVAYDEAAARYRSVARRYVRAYAADAAFNGLAYDRDAEREQVAAYADAVRVPGTDDRLPAWRDAALDPETVRAAAAADLETARDGETVDAD